MKIVHKQDENERSMLAAQICKTPLLLIVDLLDDVSSRGFSRLGSPH